MIILDTNVLSAPMRSTPDVAVVEWLDRQPAESVWITSITLFETQLGLDLLPRGRRRRALELAFGELLERYIDNRVLDFDRAAAVRTRQDRRRQAAASPAAAEGGQTCRTIQHFFVDAFRVFGYLRRQRRAGSP